VVQDFGACQVRTSCGCVAPIDEFPFVLRPDERRRVRFQIQDYVGVGDGDVLGNATFYVEEPTTPIVQVSFRASVAAVEHSSVAKTN